MKADHERIWLQNAADAAAIGASREWCSAPVWPDDPGDGDPTEYVRADLLATARAEARKAALLEAAKLADERAGKLHAEANIAMFSESATARRCALEMEDLATAIRALIEHEKEG